MPKAIVIYGPPGAGKGTQAELIAKNFDFIHFDTGRKLRQIFRSPESDTDPVLKEEKKKSQEGKLLSGPWILEIVSDAVERISSAGTGIVLSGSPRTLFEAVGSDEKKGVFELLEDLYGKENVHVVELNISPEESVKRNEVRFVCSVCGLPKLGWIKSDQCVFCAGPFRKRADDGASKMEMRIQEYKEKTKPVLEEAKKRGHEILEVNADPLPYEVFAEIQKRVGLVE